MTYERFCYVTLRLKDMDEKINSLYKMKVDLIDLVDPYTSAILELIKEIYGEEGYDWYSWFCWESDYGQKDWNRGVPRYKRDENGAMILIPDDGETVYGATDENGNSICYDFESTWKYLEEIRTRNK
jgi:hypothetical protein